MTSITTQRIAAVDVFRALTMFLMLFVNDIPGLKNIPHWLLHAEMNEDMMGFSDTIFPAFLLCMGLSIPFAIESRYKRGDTTLQVITHISERTIALVTMGLFTLNSGGVENGISHQCFTILMVIGFFLIWNVYPHTEGANRYLFKGMRTAGIGLLVFLIVYKDIHGVPFHQGWWGILGLIGWTYAVCAVIYLFTHGNFHKNITIWIIILSLAVVSHSELIPKEFGSRILLLPFIPSDWTLHAFSMSGIIISLIMQKYATKQKSWRFIGILFGIGILMLSLALFAHQHWIISKIRATPTWLFYCLALFFPLFGMFYWLMEVKGKAAWFNIIKPAGSATLTCYILPYIWYPLQQLLGWGYPQVLNSGIPGLLKSLAFSLVIVLITGLLTKAHIKLKI